MFRSNKMNLVISIVAAIAIWVYVVTLVNPTTNKTFRSIPVKLINVETLADNGLTVSPSQAFNVDVVVKGSRADLNNISDTDIVATADMTGFPSGKNAVNVNVTAPENIQIEEVRPAKIEVEVEPLVSVTKPVILKFVGDLPQGVEPGFITISPQEISVSGTEEIVNNVDKVMVKVETGSLSPSEETVTSKAEAYSKSGEVVYGVTFSQSDIEITSRLCRTKEVPLKINLTGEVAKGHKLTSTDMPNTITIRGSEAALAGINEISSRDINIGGLKETTIFSPDLYLPKNVEFADGTSNVSVAVCIDGIEVKSISLNTDRIRMAGLPKAYTVHVMTSDITVNLYGKYDQLRKIASEDISAFIDFSNVELKDGSADMSVQFDNDNQISRIECVPAKVRVSMLKIDTSRTVVKNIIAP